MADSASFVKFSNVLKDKLAEHLTTVAKNAQTIDELEIRLGKMLEGQRTFSPKFKMPIFRRLVTYLKKTYPTYTDSMGAQVPGPQEEYQLDVSLSDKMELKGPRADLKDTRIRVLGRQNIQDFCLTNDRPDYEDVVDTVPNTVCDDKNKIAQLCKKQPFARFENKVKQSSILVEDYDFRIQSSTETPITGNAVDRVWEIIKNTNFQKFYRYKKRFIWVLPQSHVKFELSVVKEATGTTFEASGVLRAPEKYEIEMEYLNVIDFTRASLETIIDTIHKDILRPFADLLKSYQESYDIISNTEADKVAAAYSALIGHPGKGFFIGLDLVALQNKHMVPDPKTGIIPIMDKYSTPKADGVRHLIYTYNGTDASLVGNVYIINSRMQVRSTGVKATPGDLFDSEFIEIVNTDSSAANIGTGSVDSKTGATKENTWIPIGLIFDCFYSAGQDVRGLNLEGRLAKIDPFVQIANKPNIRFEKKEYIKIDGRLDNNRVLLERDWGYPTDGLIFTPGGSYKVAEQNRSRRWDEMTKWKPIEQLSIDFLVRIRRDKFGKDLVYQDKTGKSYKIMDLMAVIYDKAKNGPTFVKFTGGQPFRDGMDNMAKVYLSPDGTMRTLEGQLIYDNSVIEFIWQGQVGVTAGAGLAINSASAPASTSSNQVIHMPRPMGEPGWVPLRFREEKTEQQRPNHLDTAQDNWRQIVSPITREMIIGAVPIPNDQNPYYVDVKRSTKLLSKEMRSFHNSIKDDLINRTAEVARMSKPQDLTQPKQKGLKLLDMGSGKAGDLRKWVGSDSENPIFSYVMGIEYSLLNLTMGKGGALQRYNELNNKNIRINFIYGDAGRNLQSGEAGLIDESGASKITDYGAKLRELFAPDKLGDRAFDVVSCQFAIHYFFKDRETVNNFFYNIYQNLRDGGFFIGTTLMGEQIVQFMQGRETKEGTKNGSNLWKIYKNYKDEDADKPALGREISVMHISINPDQALLEYLVYFSLLKDIAGKFGLQTVSDQKDIEALGPFADSYGSFRKLGEVSPVKMSPDEEAYSYLNGYYIFKMDHSKADISYITSFLNKESVLVAPQPPTLASTTPASSEPASTSTSTPSTSTPSTPASSTTSVPPKKIIIKKKTA